MFKFLITLDKSGKCFSSPISKCSGYRDFRGKYFSINLKQLVKTIPVVNNSTNYRDKILL